MLLTLAIVSHHFTAMGAVQIVPDPMLDFADNGLSPATLALAVAAAAIAVLGMSLIGAIADSFLARRTRQFARARQELIAESKEQLRQQNIRLDTALNNMSQGLCMFNADEEIVVFNRRFLEMYKLSPQVVKPGCKLRELIQHRKEVGLLDADPETYYRGIIDDIRQGKTTTWLVKTTEGRLIQAFNQPMPGGGWVTTHEDVTERRHAEDQVREQKLQMDAALDNISQGLLMFDADGRLILWNRRYLELYDLAPDVDEARTDAARVAGAAQGSRHLHARSRDLRGRAEGRAARGQARDAHARARPTAASSPSKITRWRTADGFPRTRTSPSGGTPSSSFASRSSSSTRR